MEGTPPPWLDSSLALRQSSLSGKAKEERCANARPRLSLAGSGCRHSGWLLPALQQRSAGDRPACQASSSSSRARRRCDRGVGPQPSTRSRLRSLASHWTDLARRLTCSLPPSLHPQTPSFPSLAQTKTPKSPSFPSLAQNQNPKSKSIQDN